MSLGPSGQDPSWARGLTLAGQDGSHRFDTHTQTNRVKDLDEGLQVELIPASGPKDVAQCRRQLARIASVFVSHDRKIGRHVSRRFEIIYKVEFTYLQLVR